MLQRSRGWLSFPGMDLLVEFFRHNAMMNGRLVEACRQLPAEQLGATATGTYGTMERFAHGDARLEEAATQAGQDRRVQVTGDDPPGTWWMPVSLFLLQAVNHGTEHRSQVATILTQLGVEPPEMDGWAYFFASGQMVAV